GVPLRQHDVEHQLQKFVVGEGFPADRVETVSCPFTMANIMRCRFGQTLLLGFDRVAHAAALIFMGLKRPPGESVKISHPVSVIPMECSHCAESVRSRVT